MNAEVRVGSTLLVRNDSVAYMNERMDAKSVDVISTSPPYNLGIKYDEYDDSMPGSEYLAWTKTWLEAAWRVLSDDGSLFLNLADKPTCRFGPEEVALLARDLGWRLQTRLCWAKNVSVEGVKTDLKLVKRAWATSGLQAADLKKFLRALKEEEGDGTTRSFGQFKPLHSERFVNECWEPVFHFTKTCDVTLDKDAVGVPFEDDSNLTRVWGDGPPRVRKNVRCRGNVWFLPYEVIKAREERPHPAPWPVKVADMCMRLHGVSRTRLTLDPFGGIGNSAVAAARLGLPHVSVDVSARYHAEAVRRVRAEAEKVTA